MKRERNTYQPRKGKQNIFRIVSAGRENILFGFITDLFFGLSSYPSFIAEVFMRKKFGERYYTLATTFVISVFMLIVWFTIGKQGREAFGFTWLPFLALFLWKSIRHRMEIRKYGTAYDFDRFSYSQGEILPFWWQLIGKKVAGLSINTYHIYVFFEPALPTFIGLFLTTIPFTRGIGVLIFLSGLAFGFRNFIKTKKARDYVLDIIDDQICMEGKHDVLVEEKPMNETKGLSFPIELPKSRELREDISNSIDKNPLDIWDDGINDEELSLA
ncbi:MAG: hypothetical protein AAGC64_04570 [Bacteroidota bacterium]